MELNKIYKYFGIPVESAFAHMKEKFTEAFAGFDGVSFEDIDGTYKIYMNAEKTMYITITVDTETLFITIKFGVNGDEREISPINKSSYNYYAYTIVRTKYGVAFSRHDRKYYDYEYVGESYITSFFAVGNPNVFINTETYGTNNGSSSRNDYICSNMHEKIERQQNFDRIVYNYTTRTKLFNAGSMTYPVDCEHLYRIAYSDGKVGKIKVGDKYFISGVRYALEYDPNDDGKDV